MGFWMMFWIALAFQVAGELLRPKQKFENAKPSSIGDFNFPTADQTRVIPKWWGTCKFEGPNTAWFGDIEHQAISKRVKTGWFSSTEVTQGFRYYLGAQMVFGYGYLDELIDFRFDNKSVFGGVQTTADYYRFTMNAPSLLDNGDPKNGVSGPVVVYRGSKTQTGNAYLQAQWNEPGGVSGYRDVIHAVFEHCYLGNSDTPPAPALIGRSTPNPLGLLDGKENINGDANPANMIFETMTDTFWGMGLDELDFDLDTFVAGANTLAGESLGLSYMVETPMRGSELLGDILRHIDGVTYKDPMSGQWALKLVRDDYNVNDLQEFDNSNIVPGSFEFSRSSWSETKNTTVVNYVDRDNDFNRQSVQYQDAANVFVRGGVIDSETFDFYGVSNKTAATVIAARINKSRSSPLARMQFKTNREGWRVRPASVIKVFQPDYGFFGIVMRVIDVDYGTLDEPQVTIICTEDIFAVNALAFDPPQDTGWVPVWAQTLPLEAARLVEVPFEMLDTEKRYVMALGVRAEASTQGFNIWSGQIEDEHLHETGKAVGTLAGGTLLADYPVGPALDEVGFSIDNARDMTLLLDVTDAEREQGKNLLMVGNEIMAWRGHTVNVDGTVTITGVMRAVMDTVPATHLAGSQVYFFNESIPRVDGLAYPDDRTIVALLATYSGDYTLPLEGLLPVAITTRSRALRPNPPGRFRINGVSNYQVGPQTGLVSITWSPRNKTIQGVLSQDAVLTVDEGQSGVLTQITIIDAATGAVLLRSDDAYEPEAWFSLDATRRVRVELRSIDFDGQLSLRAQVAEFDYTATGLPNNMRYTRPPEFNAEDAVTLAIVEGVVVVDCRYSEFTLKLNQDAAVEFINVPVDHVCIIQVEQLAPGGHDLTFPANVVSLSGIPYVPTARIGEIDIVGVATTNAGLSWDLKTDQPVPDPHDLLVVNVTPNPAANSVETDGVTPEAPSVQVVAAVTSDGTPVVPAAIAWTRSDSDGGTDFLVAGGDTLSPTFSIASGTTNVPAATQQWAVNVRAADGREARDVVAVSLGRVLVTSVVTLQDHNLNDYRPGPKPASVGIRLSPDTNAYRVGGFGGTIALFTWLVNGNPSDYKVKATVGPGDDLPSGVLGEFVGLEADRSWVLGVSYGAYESKTCALTLEIQDKATSTPQAMCVIDLNAESI